MGWGKMCNKSSLVQCRTMSPAYDTTFCTLLSPDIHIPHMHTPTPQLPFTHTDTHTHLAATLAAMETWSSPIPGDRVKTGR